MKWSCREDLVLGRTLDLLVVLINMYKNWYGIAEYYFPCLGGVVRDSWTICREHGYI
jgi:hypothetical protein